MKVSWLGQAGLWFESGKLKIMIDPYLSDSVRAVNPQNYRRAEADRSWFRVKPDVMIFTHNHLDHYDPETVSHFLKEDGHVIVLSPESVWGKVRKFGGGHNYVLFNRYTEWTQEGIRFQAVPACHSDAAAIGIIMDDGEKVYYVTGDTLYNKKILRALPEHIDVVFLPINGVGNNMNLEDASRFAADCGAEKVVPVHFGMFDEINPEDFVCENRVIPQINQEIHL